MHRSENLLVLSKSLAALIESIDASRRKFVSVKEI
jgi:hypothetical protein